MDWSKSIDEPRGMEKMDQEAKERNKWQIKGQWVEGEKTKVAEWGRIAT